MEKRKASHPQSNQATSCFLRVTPVDISHYAICHTPKHMLALTLQVPDVGVVCGGEAGRGMALCDPSTQRTAAVAAGELAALVVLAALAV